MQSLRSTAAYLSLAIGVLTLLPGVDSARARKPPGSDKATRQRAAEPESRDKARQLAQEGVTALAAKDLAGAARALSAAYRITPSVQILYALGQLALAEGRTVDAQDLFRRYLHDTTEPAASPARQEAQRVLLLPAPPPGEVRIVGDRNSLILIDDRVVGMIPLSMPLLLPAGEHQIVLEHDSQRLEDRVTVLAGRIAELRCQFQLGVLVATYAPALLVLTDYPGLLGEPLLRLQQGVEQAAQGSRLNVLAQPAALVQAPKLADCLDKLSCRVELATQNLVLHALTLKAALRKGTSADWQLQVALIDATVGEVAKEQQQECSGCTAEQVAERLAQSAAEVLKGGLGRPHGTLEIQTSPVGAEVFAGDSSLGVTPLRRLQWAGPLALSIRHPGYRTHPVTLTIDAGQTTSLKLQLAQSVELKITRPPTRPPVTRLEILPRPRWRLAVGGAAIGVGVGLLALGVSALTVNGTCVPNSFKGTQCQNLYSTTDIGVGLGIGGALLLGGGAALVALPGKRHLVVEPAPEEPSGRASRQTN